MASTHRLNATGLCTTMGTCRQLAAVERGTTASTTASRGRGGATGNHPARQTVRSSGIRSAVRRILAHHKLGLTHATARQPHHRDRDTDTQTQAQRVAEKCVTTQRVATQRVTTEGVAAQTQQICA